MKKRILQAILVLGLAVALFLLAACAPPNKGDALAAQAYGGGSQWPVKSCTDIGTSVTYTEFNGQIKTKNDECVAGNKRKDYSCLSTTGGQGRYKQTKTYLNTYTTSCGMGTVCQNGVCVALCGNGVIDAGENCGSCFADVSCAAGEECQEGRCVPGCTDTDGGLNYNVVGTAYGLEPEADSGGVAGMTPEPDNSWKFNEVTDYCFSLRNLMEHSCQNFPEPPYSRIDKTGYTCEHWCLNGRCVGEEEGPKCLEVIPEHNDADGNRINVVFVGQHYDDTDEFFSAVEKVVDYGGEGTPYELQEYDTHLDIGVIYGFLGVEPYKTNKELFNFWYIDQIYNLTPRTEGQCDALSLEFIGYQLLCPTTNRYNVHLCNYHTQLAGNNGIGVSMINEEGEFSIPAIGVINHELGGHVIGGLSDVVYPQWYDWSDEPNCAGTIEEAQNWWGDQIGDGCGDDSVIDCSETCFVDGTCESGEYQTEVRFSAVKPEDCFIGDQFIEGCSLDLKRAEIGSENLIRRKHFSLKAMTKGACQESTDNCMYWDSGNIYCYDKHMPREDLCESLTDKTVYPDFPHHDKSGGCKYRPYLNSIMGGSSLPKFGPADEKEICERLKEKVGSVGGYCTSAFGIS